MLCFVKELFSIFSNTNTWSVENVISFLFALFAVTGGVFALFQWISANKTKRAELINLINEKLRFDQEMVEAIRMVEYDDLWYTYSFHNSQNGTEARIDKLLSYLSYICYIKQMGVIRKKEFTIFEYSLNRTCSSWAVQKYLWNLYHFSKSQGTKCSYQFLIDYGIKNKLIDKKSFMDPRPGVFPKYLNF